MVEDDRERGALGIAGSGSASAMIAACCGYGIGRKR
jgi:hypothetical protein